MSELDPIRAPASRRYARSLVVAAAVVLGLILSMSWWGGAEWWKLIVAGGISGAVGQGIAFAFLRERK